MSNETSVKIYGINGPVVTVESNDVLKMSEMVYVGNENLIGEVIGIGDDYSIIQVYESTTGIRPGEPVTTTGRSMSLKLGPGIVSNIFDGILRPLLRIKEESGAFIDRGINIDALDHERLFDVTVKVEKGQTVKSGDIFCTCPETPLIEHRCMVPNGIEGEVVEVVPNGQYNVDTEIIKVKTPSGDIVALPMWQEWPIRVPRPFEKRIPIDTPLVTGQRVIDTLFPIAKGGCAAIPGGFGTGKTMTQHQLAKWCDADIIVYVGCGERGNEMTQVLDEFAELIDPKSNEKLTNRTVLIANTSNMPVAAREASIYTGITLGEFYRDMGYHVAIMADSTSRWAEALREISGRLEEMPAEEGYPAYLPSRLAAFYERAGFVHALSGQDGSVSIIGAVSPQGGDFSEPVTQNTQRFTRCFWALDKQLAYARHYPSINWLQSYSEYFTDLAPWFSDKVNEKFAPYRTRLMALLQEESRLMEIVKLIGGDFLPDDQKLIIEIARVIRVGFLQQNAFHASDTYVPLEKQFKMMEVIVYLYNAALELVGMSVPMSVILGSGLFESLIKIKYDVPNDQIELIDGYKTQIDEFVEKTKKEYANILTLNI
ncbi:MAG: V-type ATP synthase subunit A [Clostridia bacterium]|nr:V-type ATP synthase subunit A [Clostridia bacterium]